MYYIYPLSDLINGMTVFCIKETNTGDYFISSFESGSTDSIPSLGLAEIIRCGIDSQNVLVFTDITPSS